MEIFTYKCNEVLVELATRQVGSRAVNSHVITWGDIMRSHIWFFHCTSKINHRDQ